MIVPFILVQSNPVIDNKKKCSTSVRCVIIGRAEVTNTIVNLIVSLGYCMLGKVGLKSFK